MGFALPWQHRQHRISAAVAIKSADESSRFRAGPAHNFVIAHLRVVVDNALFTSVHHCIA